MKTPIDAQVRLTIAVVLVVFLLSVVGAFYWRGKKVAEADLIRDQLRVTEGSAEISRETADIVAADQSESFRRYQQDEVKIRERIDASPRASGPADADLLRVAREAHARAVCAAGRVQREDCGPDSTGSAKQR